MIHTTFPSLFDVQKHTITNTRHSDLHTDLHRTRIHMASTSIFERLACEANRRSFFNCNPARLPFLRHYWRLQNLTLGRPYIQLGLDWRYWGISFWRVIDMLMIMTVFGGRFFVSLYCFSFVWRGLGSARGAGTSELMLDTKAHE
jgi:hypothetical protein